MNTRVIIIMFINVWICISLVTQPFALHSGTQTTSFNLMIIQDLKNCMHDMARWDIQHEISVGNKHLFHHLVKINEIISLYYYHFYLL